MDTEEKKEDVKENSQGAKPETKATETVAPTIEDLQRKLTEAEQRAANKADEAARHYKKIEAFEKEEKKRLEAQMTKEQLLEKQNAEYKARADTAAAEANPANAVTGGLAAVAQFAAGLARIITNIAKAKQLLSAEVPQKYPGGYVQVTGADDGRRYNARRLGSPATGMLPPGPALVDTLAGPVLANEVAQEYFVSADALRNPYVFDMVRAIDNISRARQFQNGGYTAAETSATSAAPPSGAGGAGDLTPLLRRLLVVLESGIYARVDDDTLIDMRNRLNVLERAAGN